MYINKILNQTITGLSLSPDMQVLATSSKDGDVKFWGLNFESEEKPRYKLSPSTGIEGRAQRSTSGPNPSALPKWLIDIVFHITFAFWEWKKSPSYGMYVLRGFGCSFGVVLEIDDVAFLSILLSSQMQSFHFQPSHHRWCSHLPALFSLQMPPNNPPPLLSSHSSHFPILLQS